MPPQPVSVDITIFGGGAAGLWLLDELVRRGHSAVLLEAGDLGSGQTVASQGILHGGMKYSLGGLLTGSARAVREMPLRWRRALAGESGPDLRATRLRGDFCHLWRTEGIGSRLAMIGARVGLHASAQAIEHRARPDVLALCPGEVARLEEQVIEPASFVQALADRHRGRLLRIDGGAGLELELARPGEIDLVRLLDPASGEPLDLRPRRVVFTAGAGNDGLRQRAGLAPAMQLRPLHMVMVRGDLPWLNGHCIDGGAPRLTITSALDGRNATVWQLGGEIAERGADLGETDLLRAARAELAAALPGIDLQHVQWATYRADRAEARTAGGRRPDGPAVYAEGNTITAWPTKLVLVPQLVEMVVEALGAAPPSSSPAPAPAVLPVTGWPAPVVAMPPWETAPRWSSAS